MRGGPFVTWTYFRCFHKSFEKCKYVSFIDDKFWFSSWDIVFTTNRSATFQLKRFKIKQKKKFSNIICKLFKNVNLSKYFLSSFSKCKQRALEPLQKHYVVVYICGKLCVKCGKAVKSRHKLVWRVSYSLCVYIPMWECVQLMSSSKYAWLQVFPLSFNFSSRFHSE